MQHRIWLTACCALVIAAWALTSAHRGSKTSAAPPLSLEGYLDEKLEEAPAEQKQLLVDNSACYVCHKNYDGEPLVMKHGAFEIGCVACHGESDDHRNDEENTTPPERMFALEDVDKMCSTMCHETHEASAKDVIARWRDRCPEKTNPDEIACTDCHFRHRLARRTVRWNKKTGELIVEAASGAERP
jgi:hypothetical protein